MTPLTHACMDVWDRHSLTMTAVSHADVSPTAASAADESGDLMFDEADVQVRKVGTHLSARMKCILL
jgi:hypothetical protein